MKPLPARISLTVRYVAILVPLLLVFALALELWFRAELEEAMEGEISREADLVLELSQREAEHATGREQLARHLNRTLSAIEHPTRVSDAHGLLARPRPRKPSELADAVLEGRRSAGARIERQVPCAAIGTGFLKVEVAADDRETLETIAEFRFSVLAALTVTLLLSGGGGYYLAARALRPVDEIARTAARIDARSLDARVPARPVDDELGRLVATLNSMLARIEDGVGAARRFTQDASHELKTPLAAIRGTVDVALLAPRKADEDERALQAVARECERLERIVADLLTIAKADAGALTSQRERIDLRSVGAEIVEVGEILAQERGARLEGDLGPEPLPIEGDLARLRQVGLNLVDNAIRYGKPQGRVWLRLSHEGASALLVVEDDGQGIAPAEREKVFERFYRTRRDVAGVGLGLAIVRAIVREHHGTVVAAERPGGGARFEVRIPLAPTA